jgi:single-strand DNA-binding protein
MNIKGRVKQIHPVESVGTNNFQKRKVWVEIDLDSKYPQTIEIEFQGEKCSLADSFKPGDMVDFSLNLRGREWSSPAGETKVFNTITAWKVAVESSGPGQIPSAPVQSNQDEDEIELPF